MSLAAALAAFALQAAAAPPCTAEDVRAATVPPNIAWVPASAQHDVPADKSRYVSAALGANAAALTAAPDFRLVPLPMSPYDYAFFVVTGETMKLYMCRGAACQTGYDGPKREIFWLSTFTQNMPDLAFDRTEVQVFDRGRYRRVCNVS